MSDDAKKLPAAEPPAAPPVPAEPPAPRARVDRKLLELLVCPLTKDRLDYDIAAQELVSRRAKLAYPIRDGIPIMLPAEARPIE